MAVLSLGDKSNTVFLRNAIFRMIVARAQKYLVDFADIKDLKVSRAVGSISFDLLNGDQWMRMVEAVYRGTQDLKHEVIAGTPTEEPVRAGIQKKLDEILALISCFLYQEREMDGREGRPDG